MTRTLSVDPDETCPKILHAVIKHQANCRNEQKRKISALKRQNKRLQIRFDKIAKWLEPIQDKIEALKDVNLQAQNLIKKQHSKEHSTDQQVDQTEKGDQAEQDNLEV